MYQYEESNAKKVDFCKGQPKRKEIVQRAEDPVEELLKEESQDTDALKVDVNAAMGRLVPLLVKWFDTEKTLCQAISTESQSKTREISLYFPDSKDVVVALRNWSPEWTIERTAGLLLDLGYYMRGSLTKMDIANKVMETGRPLSRKERSDPKFHENLRSRPWGQSVPQESGFSAGISATTGLLLRLLKTFDDQVRFSFNEVGAIMLSVFRFWNTHDAEASGLTAHLLEVRSQANLFHTATEIWAVYTYVYLTQHLEQDDSTTFS